MGDRVNQCAFYNRNITRKQPNSTKNVFLTPTFYGIPDTFHTLTLKDLFPRGAFITHTSLNQLTNKTIMDLQYQNLKTHIKAHIGPNKKYDAIPLEKLPQKLHTFSTPGDLLHHIKKGSGRYRKIIERSHRLTNIHNPAKWGKKLDNNVTYDQVKKAMIRLHSPYLDSTCSDYLSRLRLGKTLFNNQLYTIGMIDENTCNTCTREYTESTPEDYRHALFHCPAVQMVIGNVTNTFFPNEASSLDISDILVSINSDKHTLYKGPVGQELASIIWDYFQVYVLQCRVAQKTPVTISAIFEIRSQLNRILKLLPKSKLAMFIKSSPGLQYILTGNSQTIT